MLQEERDCSVEKREGYLPSGGKAEVETIRRPACVESTWRLGGSSSPDFGDPGNQPLASVSTQLLHVYFDSVFSVGVGPSS